MNKLTKLISIFLITLTIGCESNDSFGENLTEVFSSSSELNTTLEEVTLGFSDTGVFSDTSFISL